MAGWLQKVRPICGPSLIHLYPICFASWNPFAKVKYISQILFWNYLLIQYVKPVTIEFDNIFSDASVCSLFYYNKSLCNYDQSFYLFLLLLCQPPCSDDPGSVMYLPQTTNIRRTPTSDFIKPQENVPHILDVDVNRNVTEVISEP